MSSRGFFIGKIIDDLDAISSQIRLRCKLGMTDFNIIIEDFFKEILNILYGSKLKNLNSVKSNAPGLDLGDDRSSIKRAFQITSQTDAQKVNDTLIKISSEQIKIYDEIKILIIGEKKKKYSLDQSLLKKCNFSEKDIIDIADLCREIMSVDLDVIRQIEQKISKEQQRVLIELEPCIDGQYKTTISAKIEKMPCAKRSDASLFFQDESTKGLFKTKDEAKESLDSFIDKLQRLPRLTREFYGWLLDETDSLQNRKKFGNKRVVSLDYVEKKYYNKEDLRSELTILVHWGFIFIEQYDDFSNGTKITEINVMLPTNGSENFDDALEFFISEKKINATDLFSSMDFRIFGDPEKVNKS